jgi:hypothetical protein
MLINDIDLYFETFAVKANHCFSFTVVAVAVSIGD